MTGLLPNEHGVRKNGERLGPTVPTLAGRLQAAGYKTGAFVGAYVLDSRFGLARGFDRYDDRVRRNPESIERLEAERRGSEVVDAATAWLADVTTPFFLWVHLYDPHAPYEPPPEFLARAGGNPYDGEIAYADAQVGRLLELVRKRGLESSTIVATAGDHGEGLGEHGEDTHGMLAYDSTLHVPLILKGPGVSARTVVAPVTLVDLASSLLRRAGVPPAASEPLHQDLFGALSLDRDIVAETLYPRVAGWHPLSVLAGAQWKLVMSSEPELYDLRADPTEREEHSQEHAPIVSGMQARLRQLSASASTQSSSAPSPEAADRLRALGYVSSSATATTQNPGAANPASQIAAWSEFERDLALVNANRAAEALGPLRRSSCSIRTPPCSARHMLAHSRTRATRPRLSSSTDAPSHDGPKTLALSTIWRSPRARLETFVRRFAPRRRRSRSTRTIRRHSTAKACCWSIRVSRWRPPHRSNVRRRAILRTRPIGRTLETPDESDRILPPPSQHTEERWKPTPHIQMPRMGSGCCSSNRGGQRTRFHGSSGLSSIPPSSTKLSSISELCTRKVETAKRPVQPIVACCKRATALRSRTSCRHRFAERPSLMPGEPSFETSEPKKGAPWRRPFRPNRCD